MVVFKDLGIRTILTREAMIFSGCGGNVSSFTSTEFPLEYPQEQVICCWDEFKERFQNNDEFFFSFRFYLREYREFLIRTRTVVASVIES